MQIVTINEENIADAGWIHSASWKESHRDFCSAEFVEKHTPAAQAAYLRREMAAGKRLFMLIDGRPVGIVSVDGAVIGNLYVLPEAQNRGYGGALLEFAMGQCAGVPTLWVLDRNEGARRLYERHGFAETGRSHRLSETLSEIEMSLGAEPLFRLAMKHIYGDGVPEDNAVALEQLTRARELGHVEAAYNLGICYHYGYGTQIDLEKAYGLYLESANAGFGKGMELVGRFYNRGIWVARDWAQAEYWLRRAMESGDPEAAEEARKEMG